MKARLRADLRRFNDRIPVLIPKGGYIGEEDIDNSIYIGYIETSNEEYNGLELLLLNNKLIAVYSIDLDVEKE